MSINQPAFDEHGKLTHSLCEFVVRTAIGARPAAATCGQIQASDGNALFEDALADPADYCVAYGAAGDAEVKFAPATDLAQHVETSVNRAVARGVPLVLYVHGFNKNFNDSLNQSATMDHNYKCEVVALSWPSGKVNLLRGDSPFSEIREAQTRCPAAGAALGTLIDAVRLSPNSTQLISCALVIRSLGAEVLRQWSAPLGGGARAQLASFRQILLSSPGTRVEGSRAWLETLDMPVFSSFNCNDWLLATGVRVVGEKPQMGGSDLSSGEVARNTTYLDVTPSNFIGGSHDHLLNLEGDDRGRGMDTRAFAFAQNVIYGVDPVARLPHLFSANGPHCWTISPY